MPKSMELPPVKVLGMAVVSAEFCRESNFFFNLVFQ